MTLTTDFVNGFATGFLGCGFCIVALVWAYGIGRKL